MLKSRVVACAVMVCVVVSCPWEKASARTTVPGAGGDVPVLLYHHIEPIDPSFGRTRRRWTMSPGDFEAQLEWLAAQGFHPITMRELVDAEKRDQPLPDQTIILTFDDGWQDHYETVLPLLKKFNFKATFFVMPQSIGHSAYMDWEEVLAMEAAGMDIQSHSLTHPKLTTISREQAWQEIRGSKEMLDAKLKNKVSVFAYPFGYYDEEIIGLVREAGYDGAVTVSGINAGYLLRRDKSYAYVRYALEGRDKIETIAKIKKFHPKFTKKNH